MLAVHPVIELARLLPFLLGVLFLGRAGGGQVSGVVGLGIVVSLGILRWVTTTYRVSPALVQVRRGLLRRTVVSVPRDRVRSVDQTAHLMHRLLGLSRLQIGTGRSDRRKAEGLTLDGLTTTEAARLRQALLDRRPVGTGPAAGSGPGPAAVPVRPGPGPGPVAVPSGDTVIVAAPPGWLRYGPCTLSGFVVIGVLAAFGFRLVSDAQVDPLRIGPLRVVLSSLSRVPLPVAVTEVVVAGMVLVAVASTVGYLLAFWRFRLVRQPGGTLHVSRGLITTRATTLEERRLRGVEISEPLLLRWAGGARVLAVATGLRVGRGAERGGTLLLPPAPVAQARRVAGAVLDLDLDLPTGTPVTCPLRGHGPAATRRRYLRALGGALLLLAGAVAGRALLSWPAWPVWAAAGTVPVAAALAADRARSLGHAVTGGALVTRLGSVVRRRTVLSGPGIIGWTMRRTVFQRRAGLVTLIATTAAGRQHYPVQDVPVAEAVRIAEQATPGLLTPFLVPAG
jgi:putative membrane protein